MASGPSLDAQTIERARWLPDFTVAVNDSWKLAPWADALWASDRRWWEISGPEEHQFTGRRLAPDTSHVRTVDPDTGLEWRAEHGIQLVDARDAFGFSFVPGRVHLGHNSGFAAINLALQAGATEVWLLGFDMRFAQDGRRHWFGDHPAELANNDPSCFGPWVAQYEAAARMLPDGIAIINATPGSALTCFQEGSL